MLTAAVLVGAGMGAGLVLLITAAAPQPTSLRRALADLRRPAPPTDRDGPPAMSLAERVGAPLAGTSWGSRLTAGLRSDLRISARTPSAHLGSCAVLALTGLLWSPVAATALHLTGVTVPPALILWGAAVLAPLAATCPHVALRAEAAARRRAFRHALSSFLDVVSISLAGGAGVDSALHFAAGAGDSWAFAEIRRTLLEARYRGDSPWSGLARLGTELAVPELGELAAAVGLAGDEGARVRTSLAARARSLRQRGLSEIEAEAAAASERMSLPVVGLMVGFVIFVVYPAIERILTTL